MMIHVEKLTKRYGAVKALDDVSFTVQAGEAVALTGANGAGKTTALRCLLGVVAFAGRVTVNGCDAGRQGKAVRAATGYVPQEAALHDLPAREALAFYARLKKAPPARIPDVLERVGLAKHAEKHVHALSGGMKQRLVLAAALLADPPLLLLDEPTANLDAQARQEFLRLVKALNQAGKTVVFSSHRLDEVTALADRVLVLEGGRLTRDCAPHDLAREAAAQQWLRIDIPPAQREQAAQALVGAGFTAMPNGQALYVHVGAASKMAPLSVLAAARITVTDFDVVEDARPGAGGMTRD